MGAALVTQISIANQGLETDPPAGIGRALPACRAGGSEGEGSTPGPVSCVVTRCRVREGSGRAQHRRW